MLNIRLMIIALAFVMAVPMVAEAGSYIRKNGSIVAEIDGDYLREHGSIIATFDGRYLRKNGSIYAEFDGNYIRMSGSIVWEIDDRGYARKHGSIMYSVDGYTGSERMKQKVAAFLLFFAD